MASKAPQEPPIAPDVGLDALRAQVAALTAAASAAAGALGKLRDAAPPGAPAGGASPAQPTPAGTPAPRPTPAKPTATPKAPASKPVEVVPAGNKSLKYAAKQFGVSKGAMRAPLTAAAFDATKLALGIRGMAQLDAISMRAHWNLRQLFRGVDATPAVRGVDRFLQVLNPASATGKAMEGIFKRTFTSLFGDFEKVVPTIQAAFQGMVLGALYLEEAYLEARIAMFPFTAAVEEAAGSMDTMRIAGFAGASVFAVIGGAAAAAAIPIFAVGGAIAATAVAIDQLVKAMHEFDENSLGQIKTKLGKDLGFSSDADQQKAILEQARGGFEANSARVAKSGPGYASAPNATGRLAPGAGPLAPETPPALAGGKDVGGAVAAGMVQGMAAGLPGVIAGGKTLGAGAVTGARAGADAHSPSRKTIGLGHDLGEGAEIGMDQSRAGVQAAADRSLVPQMPSGGQRQRGGGVTATASAGETHWHFHFPNVKSGKTDDIKAACRAALQAELRASIAQLAVPH